VVPNQTSLRSLVHGPRRIAGSDTPGLPYFLLTDTLSMVSQTIPHLRGTSWHSRMHQRWPQEDLARQIYLSASIATEQRAEKFVTAMQQKILGRRHHPLYRRRKTPGGAGSDAAAVVGLVPAIPNKPYGFRIAVTPPSFGGCHIE
jgi:hypothetical protein